MLKLISKVTMYCALYTPILGRMSIIGLRKVQAYYVHWEIYTWFLWNQLDPDWINHFAIYFEQHKITFDSKSIGKW